MTHNLLFYPSTLPGEPLESYHVEGMTLHEWMQKNVTGYSADAEHPISATVNGVVVDPEHWDDVVFGRDTLVELRPQPQGIETIIYAVVAAVVAIAASILLKPDIPSQSNKSSGRGSKLLEANASGNQVALGDVIPEIAGRRKRFPDYLNAPRRRFQDDDPKTQSLDLLLCIGQGEYDIHDEDIYIGNTPVNRLLGAVDYQVYSPGQLINHRARFNWYNAPEVGPSVGAAGIKLGSTNREADNTWPGTLTFSGFDVTSSETPQGWGEGTICLIEIPQQIDVTDDPSGDQLFGDFGFLDLEVGGQAFAIVEREGYDPVYQVASYTPGTGGNPDVMTINRLGVPVTDMVSGTYTMVILTHEFLVDGLVPGGFSFQLMNNGVIVPGWTGFPSVTTSNARVEVAEQQFSGVWSLPITACPAGEVTSRIEWDIFAPNGIGHLNNDGDIDSRTRGVEIQYRPVGTSSWISGGTRNITGGSRDQMGWSYTLNLPYPMRPEIRVRRTEAESNDTRDFDALQWYGLKARIDNAPDSYDGVTVIAMTMTGSDKIASATESQVNCIPTRKLPVRQNGQWTPPQVTRDIAPWFAYIAKDAGYSDNDLDLDEMDRLDAIWKARGDTFDYIEADDSTVKEALVRVLRAGMGEATIRDGLLTPVRDGPRTQVEHVYSAQNFIEEFTYDISMPHPTDTDGIDVEYVDSENWTEAEVKCRLPGDNGFKTEKVRLDGVTSREQAYQIGMRERRKIKYRRSSYRFATELDALNSHYMGYNAIISDVPGQGQSMLCDGVQDIGSNRVTVQVTEPLNWSADEPHVVAWRRPDGTMAGPYQAIEGSHEFEVTMFSNDGVEPPVVDIHMEWPHVYFGPESTWKHAVLITSIEPQGFESVSVQAVNYDDRVYLDDDSQPPPA